MDTEGRSGSSVRFRHSVVVCRSVCSSVPSPAEVLSDSALLFVCLYRLRDVTLRTTTTMQDAAHLVWQFRLLQRPLVSIAVKDGEKNATVGSSVTGRMLFSSAAVRFSAEGARMSKSISA